jgi:GDP-L-fucose synthase
MKVTGICVRVVIWKVRKSLIKENNMYELKNRSIFVTGASSMIGSYLTQSLMKKDLGNRVIAPKGRQNCNCLNYEDIRKWLVNHGPFDTLFSLAAVTGNIKVNRENPANIYRDNLLIGINTLDACRVAGVKRIIMILPSCAYGGDREYLFEDEFLESPSHESVFCHGMARRAVWSYGSLLNKQYGMEVIGVVVNNSYSERESVDLEKTKFLGSLIKKFVDAKRDNKEFVDVWGTGRARREVIHGQDVAEGLIAAAEGYHDSQEVINIGWGEDFSIADYCGIIKTIVEYKGTVRFDHSKPDGQLVKRLDVNKMSRVLSWKPSITLGEGIQRCVETMVKES